MHLSEIYKWFIAVPVAFIFLLSGRADAQFDPMSQFRSMMGREERDQGSINIRAPRIGEDEEMITPGAGVFTQPGLEMPLDRTVDPAEYILGPGDFIGIYLWGEIDRSIEIRVTPDGYLRIPTVGAVKVSEHTLKDAGEIIRREVHKKYRDIETSVNLLAPRSFRLYVSGTVTYPGLYNANPLMRVSDILTFGAGLIEREDTMSRLSKKGSSKRAIVIFRGENRIEVDLLKFEKYGDLSSNPYLTGGDRIHVPSYIGDISVEGEVNQRGIYEFKPGDSIYDLLVFAGGITAVADTSRAILARFDPTGRVIENIDIDLYDVFNNPDDPEYLLEESDRLFVYPKFEYKQFANFRMRGEVRFPGEYPLTMDETKLSDAIMMAGGFTDKSNLGEAYILKHETTAVRDLEFERLKNMRPEDMTREEYSYFIVRSRMMENVVAVDFEKLFNEGDMSHDIVLDPGDLIVVPVKRELISVIGAVESPGFLVYNEAGSGSYYIEKAGGYSWNASRRNARIINATTGQRFRLGRGTRIEPGDIIFVPERRQIEYWDTFRDTMQVFANMATVIIVIRNAF